MAIVLTRSADGSLTVPAELLDERASMRYSVVRDGAKYVLTPDSNDATPLTHEEWMRRMEALAKRVAESWPDGQTAVDAVNAIRR